jgi:hypothetical protein
MILLKESTGDSILMPKKLIWIIQKVLYLVIATAQISFLR